MSPIPRDGFDADEVNPAEVPEIIVNGRDLRDVTGDALDALKAANDPPVIFATGTQLVRLRTDQAEPHLEVVSRDALRGRLARVANWRRAGSKGELVPVPPPPDVVADLISLPAIPVPRVDRVVTAPTFGPDGTIQTHPGYHAASRTYFADNGMVVPKVPAEPNEHHLRAAVGLLGDQLLGEFPFAGDAERAHAFSLLLLPFARDLIAGNTPLHLIEAPTPGTGKGLLLQASLLPALGRSVPVMSEARDEDEWRKRITAKLSSGSAVIVIDNLRRRLDTASVAAVLTTPWWEDRLLGHTRIVRLPVRACFAATGNNPALSSEIARRTVRIRLDARVDRPWLRVGFRHPNLAEWATEHRGDLVGAALTVIQAWIAAGRPHGKATLGMFESWARTMGGILGNAGIPGLLGNLESFYAASDYERQAWAALVDSWWKAHGEAEVGVADLWPLVENTDSLLDPGTGTEKARRTTFGKRLAGMRDRQFGQYRVLDAGTYQGTARWKLLPIRGRGGPGGPVPPPSEPLRSTESAQPNGAGNVHDVHHVHEIAGSGGPRGHRGPVPPQPDQMFGPIPNNPRRNQ